MNIGILGHGFILWHGGIDFLRNVIASLLAEGPNHSLQIILPLRGPRVATRGLARNIRRRITGKSRPYPSTVDVLDAFAEFKGRVGILLIDLGIRPLERICRENQIDVLCPSIYPLPHDFGIPWVGYIADFQHKKLPHFFSKQEISDRDSFFHRVLQESVAVLVNAADVANDAEIYHPSHSARKFVLPFTASRPNAPAADLTATLLAYGVTTPYFIVSNQFWLHKDHTTAFKAFALVAQEFPSLSIVCTGEPNDPRDPEYFNSLMSLTNALGIRSRLIILGIIPKPNQLSLLLGSVAAVQPTLSEGGPGGGSILEAIGMGVPALVSDIPVNRELMGKGIHFFKAGDEIALAAAMRAILYTPPVRPSSKQITDTVLKQQKQAGRVLLDALTFVKYQSCGRS